LLYLLVVSPLNWPALCRSSFIRREHGPVFKVSSIRVQVECTRLFLVYSLLSGNSGSAIDSDAFGQGAKKAGFDRGPCQISTTSFYGSSGSSGNSEQVKLPQRRMYGRSGSTFTAAPRPLQMLTIPRKKEGGATLLLLTSLFCLLISYTFSLHFPAHIAVPIDLILHSDDDQKAGSPPTKRSRCVSQCLCVASMHVDDFLLLACYA